MAYETINVEIAEKVALISLNRPDALNALNSQLVSELCDALKTADIPTFLRDVGTLLRRFQGTI